MYYLYPETGYRFVDYLALNPLYHLSYIGTRSHIARQTLCGQIYVHVRELPYARHMCEVCRGIGLHRHIIRPGLYPYALTIQLEPWAGSWVAEMCDDVTEEAFGVDARSAVGPFCTLDNAMWYIRNRLYDSRTSSPDTVPGIRLARVLGELSRVYNLKSVDIRSRPGGVQLRVELNDSVPQGTLYRVIEELDTAAKSIGFGTLQVPVDNITGMWKITEGAVMLLFPYPINWSAARRKQYGYDAIDLLSREVGQ